MENKKTFERFLKEATNDAITSGVLPSPIDFKTLTRRGIVTIVSLMLDTLNQEYMKQHNGDSLFGKQSVYKKLMTK